MTGGNRLERRLHPGIGFDAVDLAGGDQRSDPSSAPAAFVVARKERILPGQSQTKPPPKAFNRKARPNRAAKRSVWLFGSASNSRVEPNNGQPSVLGKCLSAESDGPLISAVAINSCY